MRRKGFNVMLGVIVWMLAIVGTAASQEPPSDHYTGIITSTLCSSTGHYPLHLEIQYNLLAGQSVVATFYVNGLLIPGGTFSEDGPRTSLYPNYGVGPGVAFNYPNGTVFQSVLESYDGPDGTGTVKYRSSLSWRCDTGEVVSLENGPPPVTWKGEMSVPITITAASEDSSGNVKFQKMKTSFSGQWEMYLWQGGFAANPDGCYAKFLGDDGSALCVKQVVSAFTDVQKSKTDQVLLVGTGELSIPLLGVSNPGIVYVDAKGTLKKDSGGTVTSVSINGKIGGGLVGTASVFSGTFKSTLTD